MPQTEEAAAWFAAVYQAVQEIPHGKVTSYGHIATLIGYPERPRQVGVCLKHLPSAASQPDARYNSDTVPWQRVINSKGVISPRGVNGAANHETVLAQEGVQVDRGSLGERTVDFRVGEVYTTDNKRAFDEVSREDESKAYAATKLKALNESERWTRENDPSFDLICIHPPFVLGCDDIVMNAEGAMRGTNDVLYHFSLAGLSTLYWQYH
ncbi:hypothetical protein Q7P35_009548 [Cladosporium inversicolor]